MSRIGQARALLSRLRNPWRVEVDGLAFLPTGGAIVAVNRVSPFDHLAVVSSLSRPTTVVLEPNSGMRATPGMRRTTWSGDLDSDEHPAAVLSRGELLVVFPEVVASPDGHVHRGRGEFAARALASRVPVVPAALVPAAEERYRLRLGEPIPVDRYLELGQPSDTVDGLILRGLTDLVMSRISELAGRSYRDSYAERGGPIVPGAFSRPEQARQSRAARKAAAAEAAAAEAELARILDEEEAAVLAVAAEAARSQASQAAAAAEASRQQRRQGPQQ